jgi:D-alanyl-D-alanine carboxypeptidase
VLALAVAGAPGDCDRVLANATATQAQAAVYRDGQLMWWGSRGRHADRFVIASVTKTYVATLVLRLAEQGKLSLDDPLSDFVPEVENASRITIRMLLRHRSGLHDYFGDRQISDALDDPDHRWTRDEVIAGIIRRGAQGPPNQRFQYRNTNYVLLGRVLEIAGGAGPERLLQRLIAKPLGLRRTSFRRGGRLAHAPVSSEAIGPVWTDGGIATDARELGRFTDALFGDLILKERTVDSMHAGMRDNGGYGLGISRYHSDVFGHDGYYPPFSADTTYDWSEGTTVSVVVAGRGDATAIAEKLRRATRASRSSCRRTRT